MILIVPIAKMFASVRFSIFVWAGLAGVWTISPWLLSSLAIGSNLSANLREETITTSVTGVSLLTKRLVIWWYYTTQDIIMVAWGISSVGRALRWQRRGQESESPILHQGVINWTRYMDTILWHHCVVYNIVRIN